MSNYYAYIRNVGDGYCWVGSGQGVRYTNGELRGGSKPADGLALHNGVWGVILPCDTLDSARFAETLVQSVTEPVRCDVTGIPQRPSIRRWSDPMIVKCVKLFNDVRGSAARELNAFSAAKVDRELREPQSPPPLAYTVESFLMTRDIRLRARTGFRDHWLLTAKLTDPDRWHDRTTQHMIRIQQQHLDAPDNERLFNWIAHRAISNITVIDAFGWVRDRAEARAAVERMWPLCPKKSPAPFSNDIWWKKDRLIEKGVNKWSATWLLNTARAEKDPALIATAMRQQSWARFTGDNAFAAYQLTLDLMGLVPELAGADWGEFRISPPRQKPRTGAAMKPEECFGSGAAILLAKGHDPRPYTSDPHWMTRARERGEPCGRTAGRELALQLASEIKQETGISIVEQEHWWCEHSKIMRMEIGLSKPENYVPSTSCTCCGYDKPFIHPSEVALKGENPL